MECQFGAALYGRGIDGTAPSSSLSVGILFAGLLNQSDLHYLGAFRVPSGTFGASTFEGGFSGRHWPLIRPTTRCSLWDWSDPGGGGDLHSLVRTGSLGSLSTATVLQPFVDVMARVPNITPEGNVQIGGLLVVGNQLIGTAYEYYDGDSRTQDSHFKLSSLNLSSATVTGLFQVGD